MTSSSRSRRAWEAPAVTAMSIARTASLSGGGSDNFARYDIIHRPGLSPTAPALDVGALPVPTRDMAQPPGTAWEAPVVTALPICSTAALTGGGSDNFARHDIIYRPGMTPSAPLVDIGAAPVPARSEGKAQMSDQRSWEIPVVTTVSI